MLSNILPLKTLPLRKYKAPSIKHPKNLIRQMAKNSKKSDYFYNAKLNFKYFLHHLKLYDEKYKYIFNNVK